MTVEVRETNLFGEYLYRVMVNNCVYDSFFSRTSLTWSQQSDVEAGYREALENYTDYKDL